MSRTDSVLVRLLNPIPALGTGHGAEEAAKEAPSHPRPDQRRLIFFIEP